MRFITGAIIAGAIALIIAVAVSLQMGPSEPAFQEAAPVRQAAVDRSAGPAAGSSANAGAPDSANKARSARVEERLNQMRNSEGGHKERVMAPSNRGQNLPHRDVAMPPGAGKVTEEKYPDDLDPDEYQDFDEIKETLRNNPDPDERIGAILMLTGMEGEPAWRLLADSMQDPDAEVRLAVVEALGDYSDDIQPDVLVPALNDSDAEVRFEAYGILGDMESPEAMSLVRNGLQDSDEDVRALAEGILDFSDEE
jgi:HEAT repeat protein